MSIALEFYKDKIEKFESMTFEERRAAVTNLKLDDKQHCKATLKALFRMKPAPDAISDYSYKGEFGKRVECFNISQCVPMKALPKKPRSNAQILAAENLRKANFYASKKGKAVEAAKAAIEGGNPLYCLDTETSDLNGKVIQIALVCVKTAQVLFDSYVYTDDEISIKAFEVHGISKEDIAQAPSFQQVSVEISKIIGDNKWTAFNINFDYGVMLNSAHDKTADCYKWIEQKSFCAMYDVAAAYFGATNKYGSISLSNAMAECGVEFEGKAHSASADAVATVRVIHHIAKQAL